MMEGLDETVRQFRHDGFVALPALLSNGEIVALQDAFDEAVSSGEIRVDGDGIENLNDAIFRHPQFEALARDRRICELVQAALGAPIELQHSKFLNKPLRDRGGGKVKWHQDFAFFPHTNTDLLAVGVHLDEETSSSGPVRAIPGSHRWGPLSHCRGDDFVYECTAEFAREAAEFVELTGPAGQVTLHHCLTMHDSQAKLADGPRRVLYLQYRAQDAVQLAGVVWRCTGYAVTAPSDVKGTARLLDGGRVELRGKAGRLFDLYGRLAPDDSAPAHSISGSTAQQA